jgi:hypothetical protein
MKRQSYSNHKRYIPLFHFVMLGLIICTLIGSAVNLIKSFGKEDVFYSSFLLFSVSILLLMGFFFFRTFAIRAQDRAIRAEENFRHFVLTGKPIDVRLHMQQITALRFAPDDEFIFLAKEAAERKMTSDEIKKSIKRWKGDYHRV